MATRLLAEHRSVGTNVGNALRALDIEPWAADERLPHFFRTTNAFVYETAVWNRFPAKRQMRSWLARFVQRAGLTNGRVLVYGDGLGIDAATLALLGCEVCYADVSEPGQRFASETFALNNVTVRRLADEEIEPNSFDLIVCLDVLEHLPNPSQQIGHFNGWLRDGGRLAVHAPFYLVDHARKTHLRSNVRHSGSLDLFTRQGLTLVDGQFAWNPIIVAKGAAASWRSLIPRLGQPVLAFGRLWPAGLGWTASTIVRTPDEWIAGLEAMLDRPLTPQLQPSPSSA